MAIEFQDSISLIKAVELIKPEAKFLVDTFFPKHMPPAMTETIGVEYRKQGRTLAPYIVPGSSGKNIGRVGSTFRFYKPPMLGPRRIVSSEDIQHRAFGETPIFTTLTPEQRSAQIQARDLVELQSMIENRKNQMASEILSTGKTTIRGYADDGLLTTTDEIIFDWSGLQNVATAWSQPTSNIYADIKTASEKIQEETGQIPTVMIVGKNVPGYLLSNKQIKEWLMIPSRDNLSLLSIQPKLESPQILRVGYISSLNLEIYSYMETYTDDDGTLKPFLDPDGVIIGIPGQGSQLFGAVTLLNREETAFETYSAEVVPYYKGNGESQTLSLTLYSRFLLVPDVVDTWVYMNVGE